MVGWPLHGLLKASGTISGYFGIEGSLKGVSLVDGSSRSFEADVAVGSSWERLLAADGPFEASFNGESDARL